MSCVRKIKNELLEFPIPNRAVAKRYLQYAFGNRPRLMSIFDFAEKGTRRSLTRTIIKSASRPGMTAR